MLVLIKGMEIPKECRECMLSEYHDRTGKTWCKPADKLLAEDRKPIQFDGRPDWCPIVEIKTPHGRLVDADELKTAFPVCDNSKPVLVSCVRATINHMPTVIESEGEG